MTVDLGGRLDVCPECGRTLTASDDDVIAHVYGPHERDHCPLDSSARTVEGRNRTDPDQR